MFDFYQVISISITLVQFRYGMDHQKQMTLMDPYDQSIPIEKVLGQEKKWMDAVKLASVAVKDKDPVSTSNVAWLIYNGYVPRI